MDACLLDCPLASLLRRSVCLVYLMCLTYMPAFLPDRLAVCLSQHELLRRQCDVAVLLAYDARGGLADGLPLRIANNEPTANNAHGACTSAFAHPRGRTRFAAVHKICVGW